MSFIKYFLALNIFLFAGQFSFAQDRTWQTYTPKHGEWSILSPGVMRPDEEALKPNAKQGSYSYNDFNGFFAVIYKDFGGMSLLFGKKGFFKKQRNLVVKSNNGKLLSDTEFTSGDIKGREVQVRMPDNRVIGRESNVKPAYRVQRFRMFFQGNRFYNILIVLPEAQIDSAEATNFLNSFILKESK